MRAVNLIPAEERRAGGGLGIKLSPPTMALFGVLATAIVLASLYVLAANTVASRQAELTSAQAELTHAQAEATALAPYTKFAGLAETRLSSVRGIAATRFDWDAALENISRVVPANTSLQSLAGSVVPGAGSGGGNSLRGALQGPAFELNGCTSGHVAVAQLISRLRTMPGVQRVALTTSEKGGATAGGGSAAAGAGGASTGGCAKKSVTFAMVVFYAPIPGAGPTGATSLTAPAVAVGSTGASSTATATATAASTTPSTPAGGSK